MNCSFNQQVISRILSPTMDLICKQSGVGHFWIAQWNLERLNYFHAPKCSGFDDAGGHYVVRTKRGNITERHVVLCTESYTPLLMPLFHNIIHPTQTQAATGIGGPFQMKPNVGISNSYGFFGKHGNQTMVGSDATLVPDHEASRI